MVVTNPAGPVTSNSADLAVNTPVTITVQPAALSLNAGSYASFNVVATGTEPITYQWRKGGINIDGATAATYSIASPKITDASSYSVVASNAAGSITSASATLNIKRVAPAILAWPTSSIITRGQSLSESLLVNGSASVPGTFAFSAPAIVPSVGTVLHSVTFTPSDLERHSIVNAKINVTVEAASNPPVITSATTAAGVINKPFAYKITATNVPDSFSVTGLPAGLRLNSFSGLISGTPTAGGQYSVNLRATNPNGTGNVTLNLTISADGSGENTVNWTDVTGNYAGLLERTSRSESEDEAVYRGAYGINFSRTGVFSGRISYNESKELKDSAPSRIYSPINASFAGVLAATADNPLIFQKVIRLGSATSRGSQELTVKVSFLTVPPTVNIELKDFSSPKAGESEWTSNSRISTQLITKLSSASSAGMQSIDYSQAVGRYTFSSVNSAPLQGQPNDAYFLVQVLPTGKLFWTGRMKGVFGSGSSGLQKTQEGLCASFYGGWTNSSATLLKTTSVLGVLNFTPPKTPGAWSGYFGSEALPGGLEKQASQVSKSGSTLTYQDDGSNWSGITTIDFSEKEGVCWGNANTPTVPEFLSGTAANPSTFILSARDPLSPLNNDIIYLWKVSVAANGRLSVTSLQNQQGALSPKLLLSLDKMRGEFSGSYVSGISGKNVRRNLYGCALTSFVEDSLFARGWIEAGGFPTLSTGGWKLTLER